ncbi:MAG: CAP domain-containing protein [Thermodesulfovibrionales bacterium]
MMRRLIKMLNRKRVSGGACGDRFYRPSNPLKWDKRLAKAASVHASDMAEGDRLSHNGRDGSDPGERIRSAGYRWKAFGENIGEGYRTPDDIFRAWMKSEGHCKNIMNPLFKDVGASRIINGKKTYWVLVFATPY